MFRDSIYLAWGSNMKDGQLETQNLAGSRDGRTAGSYRCQEGTEGNSSSLEEGKRGKDALAQGKWEMWASMAHLEGCYCQCNIKEGGKVKEVWGAVAKPTATQVQRPHLKPFEEG